MNSTRGCQDSSVPRLTSGGRLERHLAGSQRHAGVWGDNVPIIHAYPVFPQWFQTENQVERRFILPASASKNTSGFAVFLPEFM